jgi:alkylation response protein AidB-like acyl-CoA dehydrogenase
MALSELHEQVRDMARRFAENEIRPIAAALDQEERFPAELYEKMGELGLFGLTVPVEHGGSGLDTLGYALTMEELSRGYASVADQCGVVELCATLLSKYGTDEQRQSWLAGILAGTKRVAYCITEASAGTDVSGITTTAQRTEDGWVLDGGKLWIHNAPIADVGFVLARTDKDAGKRGMSIFVVDLSSPGVSRGPKEHKMGQRASLIGALHFDGVKLPAGSLLGTEGGGFLRMMSVLDKGRVGIAALALGIAQAGLDAGVEYTKTREQFGQRLADFQGIQWMIADMAKDIAAARLLTYDAAKKLDQGEPATLACSIAKCFASDIAVAQSANAVQLFGGSGFIRGFEVERLYRDAKITQIYEGTNQIQRTIIAREILR